MAEILNLRQARKQKARRDAADAADRNRIAHGLSKEQRALAAGKTGLEARRLDGHRLEPRKPASDD